MAALTKTSPASRASEEGKAVLPKKKGPFSKEVKAARKKRKPRLIVRNLAYKATEKTLRDHFSKYGDLVEVNVPKKDNGKMCGFAFVQFAETKSAIKAINGLNATKILGRPIAVDFALPKAIYQRVTGREGNADQGEKSDEVREDKSDDGKNDSTEGSDDDGGSGNSDSEEDEGSEDDDDSECSEEMDEGSDDDGDSESSTGESDRRKQDDTKNTLFIRNLSFDSQQESLETLMKQFGPCRYCLLCTDADTGRSKGTGFVRFIKDSSVAACLEAAASPAGLMLDGRRLGVDQALSRDQLEEKRKANKKEKKDRRNLYLAREGLVRLGTEAAHGVSSQDMAKRAKLQARKRKLLANLHYFVSPTRLSVHNLPPSVDDKKLRALFQQNAPQGARLTEARVMKNLKSTTHESHGYGFVTFTRHEDALAALRMLNNNPGIFGPNKRPIVEFCLENKAALVAKERRLQRSKKKLQELRENPDKEVPAAKVAAVPPERKAAFMGAAANRNMKGLPTHSGPKVRTKKGRAGKQKPLPNNKKAKRGIKQKRKMFNKKPQVEKDSFGTMVDKHKKAHSKQIAGVQKKKWFSG